MNDVYELQYILGTKLEEGKVKYGVKWKNYPKNQKTWEPVENVFDCMNNVQSIRRYQRVSDYLLFYKNVAPVQAGGLRIHQRGQFLEIIKSKEQSVQQIQAKSHKKVKQESQQLSNKFQQMSIKANSSQQQKLTFVKNEQDQPDIIEFLEHSRQGCDEQQQAYKEPIFQQQYDQNQLQLLQLQFQAQYLQQQPYLFQQIRQSQEQLYNLEKQRAQSQSLLKKTIKQEQIKEPQFQMEEILSEQYMQRVQSLQASLSIQEQEQIVIALKAKNEFPVFEILFQLYCIQQSYIKKDINDYLADQYLEEPHQKPQPKKVQEVKKLSRKTSKPASRNRHKLQRNDENNIVLSDFLPSIKVQQTIQLITCTPDVEQKYGYIGFDKVDRIKSHFYGIMIDQDFDDKVELGLYFVVSFQTSNGNTPLDNQISKQQALQYERDIVCSYVKEHKAELVGLSKELSINDQ